MYSYDDYYDEPNEFERQINEFKDSLYDCVKKEHKDKMNQLQEENSDLQEAKKNLQSLECKYKEKIRELQLKIDTAERDIKRKRVKELMEELKANLWQVHTFEVYKPKCDECNDKRQISFYSPSGKEMEEDCKCAKYYKKYKPCRCELYSFEQTSDDISKWNKWYRKPFFNDDYYFEESIYVDLLVKAEDDFKLITDRLYKVFFISEDLCQKYCDIQNDKNGITDEMVDNKYAHRPKKKSS